MKLMKGDSYYAGYECARNGGKNAGWFGPKEQCEEYGEGMRDFYADQGVMDSMLQQDIKACAPVDTTANQFESLACTPADSTSWGGNGLPPVGCACEFKPYDNSEWRNGTVKYVSAYTVVISLHETDRGGIREIVNHPRTLKFRPMCSEAERKRDDAISLIAEIGFASYDQDLTSAAILYDAIAAGKIPHIKVEVDDE